MKARTHDMLCKAEDIAVKAVEFYEKSYEACTTSLGMDVFQKLKEDKKEHAKRVQEIKDNLSAGGVWEQACTLPEDEVEDAKAAIMALTAKHEGETCPASELDAISDAVDLESEHLKFYQSHLKEAEHEMEKAFLERMVEETRQHYVMVTDLHSFFEDPEAWYRNQDGGLDGA